MIFVQATDGLFYGDPILQNKFGYIMWRELETNAIAIVPKTGRSSEKSIRINFGRLCGKFAKILNAKDLRLNEKMSFPIACGYETEIQIVKQIPREMIIQHKSVLEQDYVNLNSASVIAFEYKYSGGTIKKIWDKGLPVSPFKGMTKRMIRSRIRTYCNIDDITELEPNKVYVLGK